MGLEDFMDMSDDSDNDGEDEQNASTKHSDTSTNTELTDTEKERLSKDDWYRDENGKVRPRGPFGYGSKQEYDKTVKGMLEVEKKQFKHKAPVMTRIDDREPLQEGDRHQLYKANGTWSCVVSERRKLQNIPRECVMLDTGEPEKSDALDVLEDRMGFRPEGEDEVTLTVFIHTRHAVKIALAESEISNFGVTAKQNIMEAVYGVGGVQKLRLKDAEVDEIKKRDEIQMW